MNRELYEPATYPGVNATNSRRAPACLSEIWREQALDALTARVGAPQALALADALAEPLAKANEAATEPLAAVDRARKALAKEQQKSIRPTGRVLGIAAPCEPDDRERPPAAETPEVEQLQAALAEAEQAAMPFAQRAAYHEEQIRGLLDAPDARLAPSWPSWPRPWWEVTVMTD